MCTVIYLNIYTVEMCVHLGQLHCILGRQTVWHLHVDFIALGLRQQMDQATPLFCLHLPPPAHVHTEPVQVDPVQPASPAHRLVAK